ncbi:MAG TPA: CoA activase [Chloroflexi bacterium]|nr:CoA activase [Chloroflexota bacterium]
MQTHNFRMGIDVGSTTAKVVLVNRNADLLFSAYRRHQTETVATLRVILEEALHELGDITADLLVTGSAGMGISETFDLPFIQEVVASAEVVKQRYPDVKTLIDIGGEDAKMIFFNAEGRPDIRMNGSCAGGTGAFIDEMATLLNVPVSDLDDLASRHSRIYPMASRCGVFAKTDLQNLLSRDIPKEDIAASVFHAVVLQTLATLSRGYDPSPALLFSGGPLTFLPALKEAFVRVLDVDARDVLDVEHAEFLPAIGAALANPPSSSARVGAMREGDVHMSGIRQPMSISRLIDRLNRLQDRALTGQDRLPPLFQDASEYRAWKSDGAGACADSHTQTSVVGSQRIERIDVAQLNGDPLFLGVDSGSTTTKLVLIDARGRVAFDYYCNNRGDAIGAVREGLREIHRRFGEAGRAPNIARSVVTGYGEDLIRAAFGFDEGMVETLAHFRAAKAFDEAVTFILDIGGQDMKAIFVKDGHIQNIEINEACSSGCGSFIESFANAMGYDVAEFARKACMAKAPCDLGARCTVFMNSRVKQALRESAEIGDIAAGLAYSVIKNALHKVLNVTDTEQLGDHIVVQGGTFRNAAVQKAMENLLGRKVICPDMAELMGAYGAALTARDREVSADSASAGAGSMSADVSQTPVTRIGLAELDAVGVCSEKKEIRCRGCENRCAVTKMVFPNGNVFYSGNRCENVFSNSGDGGKARKGVSLPALKYDLLFDRQMAPDQESVQAQDARLTIGIPRVLNMFENFPFWNTLFVACGVNVHLSAPSSNEIFQKGTAYVMSENLCFPAKLVGGHIMDLIEARDPDRGGVDRIFYPMVFYETREFSDAANTYNCPIVSGYADVVRSAIDPEGRFGIPLDTPPINFEDEKLLEKACVHYLTGLGIGARTVKRAFKKAIQAQRAYKEQVRTLAEDILARARAEGRPLLLLLGRPYHIDPLINHKIPDILTNFGVDVMTEDAVPLGADETLDNRHVMTQWAYINRYYHAARWAREQQGRAPVEVVQLNSFGCGPDPFILDEVKTILGEYGQYPTVIRIDEIESAGSTKLRLRSMMESIKQRQPDTVDVYRPRKTSKVYRAEDRGRTLIVPDFSPFRSPPIVRPFVDMGYDIVWLPPADQASVDVGLKYTNNEICYPGLICIGDLVKALQSGAYDLSKTAIGFSQTGGQCRATSYPSMIKKALVAAGFEDVPVVTLSTNLETLNDQPGFKFNILRYVYEAAFGMMYTDALSDMYYAVVVREKHAGAAWRVADKYLTAFMNRELPVRRRALLASLEQAVDDFNRVETVEAAAGCTSSAACTSSAGSAQSGAGAHPTEGDYPKVGIVGEIYVKYNHFSNNNVAHWLMEQDVEVVMPSFMEFFAGGLVSLKNSVQTHVRRVDLLWLISFLGKKLIGSFLDDIGDVMDRFRYGHRHHDIQEIANWAEEILSLNHQYGEGWLIAGEIASLVRDGIQNVLCLQPFGCIANHVVAKGVQKRLKERYPQLNLLFLDADAGVSEVNFFNRMHFFVNRAKAAHYKADIARASADIARASADIARASADVARASADVARASADVDRASADVDHASAGA